MNKIQSVCQRSRQCIDSVFYPAVLQSKDQPTSLLYADKENNNELNRNIDVSKVDFDYQLKLPTTNVTPENSVIDGKNQVGKSNENNFIFITLL